MNIHKTEMKTAEEIAKEFYPDKKGLDVYGVPLQRSQEIKRRAFLDAIEHAKQEKESKLREVAECKHEWSKLSRTSKNSFECECGEMLYSFMS